MAKGRTPTKTITIPAEDLERIAKIQSRGRLECDMPLNDSEVVRAAIRTLLDMKKGQFKQAVKKLVRLKRGKPKQEG
jgi:Arc/MetJ-type ribon-helix-helix transcriptional regulator